MDTSASLSIVSLSSADTTFQSCVEFISSSDELGVDKKLSSSKDTVYFMCNTGDGVHDESLQGTEKQTESQLYTAVDANEPGYTRNNSNQSEFHALSLSRCHSFSLSTQEQPAIAESIEDVSVRNLPHLVAKWMKAAEPRKSWFILFATVIPINVLLGMDFIGFSIYYVAYDEHFFDENRSTIGVIVAIKELLMCTFGLVTSVLLTRYGCRVVAISGGILWSGACLLSSFAPNIYYLYFTQGALMGIGCSMCLLSPNFLLHKSFEQNRALAGGLGMIGITLGNMAGVSFVDYLIRIYGWRGSLLIQCGITANVIPISMLMPHPDSTTPEEGADELSVLQHIRKFIKEILDFSLLKDRVFLLISIGIMLDRFNTFTFMQQMPSRAVSIGMTRTDGAMFISTCAMVILICRILVTFLSNLKCANRVLLYASGCFVGGISSVLLVLYSRYTGQVLGSAVSGVHIGITNTLTYVMLVDLMSMKKFARVMALYDLFVAVSAFSAAPFGGYLFDKTGTYDPTFLIGGALNVVGGLLITVACVLHRLKHKDDTSARCCLK